MVKALKTAVMIYALGMMIFAVFFFFAQDDLQAVSTPQAAYQAAQPAQKTAQGSALSRQTPASFTLFPGLSSEAITAISVTTPDCCFQFRRDGDGNISVNGQQADSEIYMTLVSQITDLPVDDYNAFSPDHASLLLTLVVSTADSEHTARFYEDGGKGEKARIICGEPDAPVYRQTGGWRVGTLMMTCEGTRIQDERGNETPSDF